MTSEHKANLGDAGGQVNHRARPVAQKPSREEVEMAFRDRTRAQRITENVPFDIRWQWELALSDLSPSAKLVGFIVRLYAPQNGTARPSIDAIASLSGLSRQTVLTQLKSLEKAIMISSEKGKGRASSSYTRVIPDQTLSELSVVVDFRSGQPIGPQADPAAVQPLDHYGRSGPTTGPLADSVAVQPLDHYDRSSLIGERSGLTIGPDLTDLTRKEGKGPPREGSVGKVAAAVAAGIASMAPFAAAAAQHHPVEQVFQGAAECWQNPKAVMGAGMNVQEARAQKQVWVTPTGGLEIAGEFKAEMQRMFPLVDITSALAAACVNVKVDSGAWNALQIVRRTFGYMQQDALSKQARAASYGKKPFGSPATVDRQKASEDAWLDKQIAEAKRDGLLK